MTNQNKSISQLNSLLEPTLNDYLLILNNGQDKKITVGDFLSIVDKSIVGLGNVLNIDTTTTANITDSTNKRFVTDSMLAILGVTSGVNTGDQDLSGLVTKTTRINGYALSGNINLTATDVGAPSGSGTSTGINTGDQNLSGLVPKTTTVNGKALSSDILLTSSDVGAPHGSGTSTGTNTGDQDLSGLVTKITTINGKDLSSNITLTPSDIGSPSGSGNSTGINTGDQVISDETIQISDVVTNNFSTAKHGFVPKGTGIGKFLRDDGTWQTIYITTDTIIEVTSDYTALYENATLIVKNPCTIYLPQITTISKYIIISNQSSGEVTVSAYSGNLVDGDTSMIISFNKSTAQLKSTSLGWVVV